MTTQSHDKIESDRPQTPSQEDCCGNSCNPCIFDVHQKLLKEWEEKKNCKFNELRGENYLSLIKYKKFVVKSIVEASENCIYLEIKCVPDERCRLFLTPGQHVMIRLNSTSKPYTPITWDDKKIKFLIKLYEDGIASDCFKKLKIEEELFVRGPYGDFIYNRNCYQYVVMLSIGTGIAAVYPIAVSICKDELEDTRVHMFMGFRSISHVPLKEELRTLTDYWNFECTLCLNEKMDASISGVTVVNKYLKEDYIQSLMDSYSKETTLILICGTPEFNKITKEVMIKREFKHYVFS
ncbi:hypothetical protein TKK_0013120 [Trichogramma kaykai]|uniref:FAD-binding FR-type domain-containing protein n=1 Tax=Trichogramma kaykai TaxID=54128 RepID=A0ABD2WJN8_9HYME